MNRCFFTRKDWNARFNFRTVRDWRINVGKAKKNLKLRAASLLQMTDEMTIKRAKLDSAPKEAWRKIFALDNNNSQSKKLIHLDKQAIENSGAITFNNKLQETNNKIEQNNKLETPTNVKLPQYRHLKPLLYLELALTFERIEVTSSRLEITAILSSFFEKIALNHKNDLLCVVYLCINKLGPEYMGYKLGIGEGLLIKSIAQGTGRSVALIKSELRQVGDLGLVAKNSKKNQPSMFKPRPLTVRFIFDSLKEIAQISGSQSQTRKLGIIRKIMCAAQENEPKYFIRSLEDKLRIGLAEKSVLVSLAHAFHSIETKAHSTKLDLDDVEKLIKSSFNELPCYEKLIQVLLEQGLDKVSLTCKLSTGIPIKPMLAKPTNSVTQVLNVFEKQQKFTCEFKYDGERAQIHRLGNGSTMIFSRNLEDMSKKYPDIIAAIDRWIKPGTNSFIIDCEVVAWNRIDKVIMPFQKLSTRKRRDVKEEDIVIKVCLFAFDLLYLNGESLLKKPLQDRRQALFSAFNVIPGEFHFVQYSNQTSEEDIQQFLDTAVASSCEGLMIKALGPDNATYEPSRRSQNWLKVKKDYLAGIGDSLDLVVLGAFYGKGKRTSRYGAFLLASYDKDQETFETITKIGTGFSDSDLEILYNQLKPQEISVPKPYYLYSENNKPDIWFLPTVVMEVKAADFSLSPVYKAAVSLVEEGKGISLRFPRFIKLRPDKNPHEITDNQQIHDLYLCQAINSSKQDDVQIDY